MNSNPDRWHSRLCLLLKFIEMADGSTETQVYDPGGFHPPHLTMDTRKSLLQRKIDRRGRQLSSLKPFNSSVEFLADGLIPSNS